MASRNICLSQESEEEEDDEEDHTTIKGSRRREARKRKNCGACSECLKEDCGQCPSCKDKIKFGGNGRKKQRCVRRRCSPPVGNLITSFFNNNNKRAIVADPVSTDRPASASLRENTSVPRDEKDTVENGCAVVDSSDHHLPENSVMTETTNISRTDQPTTPSVSHLQPSLECVTIPSSSKSLSPPPPPPSGVMSQAVLNWDVSSGKLVSSTPQLRAPLQEPTAVEKENDNGEKVMSGRKRKRAKSKCESGDEKADISTSPPVANNNHENCNEVDCSLQAAISNKEENTSDCLKAEEQPLESPLLTPPVPERRSRRKAAIAADSKLTQVSNDADSTGSSPLPQSKRTGKRKRNSFLNSSDEIDQEDDVTIVDSTSPVDKTACMILGADFFASTEQDSNHSLPTTAKVPLDQTMDKVVPSTSSLSSGWASLFRQPPPVKEEQSSQDISGDDTSAAVRQRKRQLTPSPRKCQSPRKNVLSPLRASPKRSPLRGSPKRSSPLRRQLMGQASPLKNHSSLVFTSSSCKQLSFGSTQMLDRAPFNSLVHVQQLDKPVLPVATSPNRFSFITKKLSPTNVSYSAMPLGTVTLATKQPHPQSTKPTQGKEEMKEGTILKVDDILAQIEQQYPASAKVRETFARYQQLSQSISTSTAGEGHCNRSKSLLTSNEQSRQQPHASDTITASSKKSSSTKSTKTKSKAKKQEISEASLVCSIRVTKRKRSGRIMVDRLAYTGSVVHEGQNGSSSDTKSRRHSLRRTRQKNKEKEEQTLIREASDHRKPKKSEVLSHEEKEVSAIEKVPPVVARSALGGEVWCDVYQPHRAEDVIGNQSAVHQLQSWLTQWKDKCQTDTKTNHSVQNGNQSTKPHALPDKEISDDPDFRTTPLRPSLRPCSLDDSFNSADLDDGDSCEDERLCPALLVCGPSGSGKTAAIMACAEQLGFKVLEVNSTQLRSKQYLLTTLREATQSHQVTGKDTITTPHPLPPTSHTLPPTSTKPPGLLSFFKSKSCEATKPKKKEKSDASNTAEIKKTSRDVSLATITVILLEEVDVVFEEELRAFWSVVYELLSSTKRPFILTANDPGFQLNHRFKKIKFSRPLCDEVSMNCQLLSLAHSYQLSSKLANQIAELLSCDLRSVFNLLQFWLARPHRFQSKTSDTIVTLSDDSLLLSILGVPAASITSLTEEDSPSPSTAGARHEFDSLCYRIEQLLEVKGRLDSHGWLDELYSAKMISLPSSSSETHKPVEKSDNSTSHEHGNTSNNSLSWKTIDHYAQLTDAYSVMDTLSCSSLPAVPLWWKTEPRPTLLDELPVQEPVPSEWAAPYQSCLEACIKSRIQKHQYQLDNTCDKQNRSLEVHAAQMCCCEVFSVQNELSRVSLATDCLPFLQIICRSERHRQTAKTKRRFLHYLHNSHIAVDAFDNFASVGSFNLDYSSVTDHTPSIATTPTNTVL